MIYYTTLLLAVAASLSACADKTEVKKDVKEGVDLAEFKWKKRIILCYPKDEVAWTKQGELLEKYRAQIKDRDLVIIRLDKVVSNDAKALMFTEAQRQAAINKYNIVPGSSLLIGKDGGAKQKQSGQLKLLPFFELIDQMPMRKREMRSE